MLNLSFLFHFAVLCFFSISTAHSEEILNFDDDALSRLLNSSPRGLIYVWSPKMPLSVRGISEVSRAARISHLPVKFVLDPYLTTEAVAEAKKYSELGVNSFQKMTSKKLIQGGGLLHFPALFFYKNGKLQERPTLGNRGSDGFIRLIQQRTSNSHGRQTYTQPSPSTSVLSATSIPVKILKTTLLPGEFGYYDKPIFGTRWMGLHIDWKMSSFFNLDSHQKIDLGYTNDTYVTPHDHLYTTFWATPGDFSGGELGIMETSEFLKIGQDPSYHPKALYLDNTINADYQSVGTLEMGSDSSTYRIVTGGYNNFLSYRDYKIKARTPRSEPIVIPLAPTGYLCSEVLGRENQHYGVPVISKDGLYLSAQSNEDQRTRIYAIDPADPQRCTVDTTFLQQTSKVAFSFDSDLLSFHVNENLYIYKRSSKKLYQLTGIDSEVGAGIPWFPEFREDGSMLVPYTSKSDNKMYIVEFKIALPI